MKLNKVITSVLVMILVFLCLSTTKVQASLFDIDKEEKSEIEKTIDKDDGGLFEKIIAKMIRRSCRRYF